tara:strand:- start:646 stop:921 length:276 start_codon:yes stop_codon:yes gene_type:complete
MFGDAALQMIRMMGRSDTVPGAILAEDVQAALERLEAGVAVTGDPSAAEPETAAGWNDEEPAVSLSHRALPLIELLQAAVREKSYVMWDSS